MHNYETMIRIRISVDPERKLNVYKTFRRRPGRLLNVLCTFNLRSVSIGMGCDITYCETISRDYTLFFYKKPV